MKFAFKGEKSLLTVLSNTFTDYTTIRMMKNYKIKENDVYSKLITTDVMCRIFHYKENIFRPIKNQVIDISPCILLVDEQYNFSCCYTFDEKKVVKHFYSRFYLDKLTGFLITIRLNSHMIWIG